MNSKEYFKNSFLNVLRVIDSYHNVLKKTVEMCYIIILVCNFRLKSKNLKVKILIVKGTSDWFKSLLLLCKMNLSHLFSDLYRNLSSKATDDDDMAIETVYLPNKFTLLTYIFTQIVVFCQLLGQVIVRNKIPHHFFC